MDDGDKRKWRSFSEEGEERRLRTITLRGMRD